MAGGHRSSPDGGATHEIAAYVAQAGIGDLPQPIRHEAKRAFLNIVGCAVGGARHPSVDTCWSALHSFAGSAQATVIGRSSRSDVVTASFVNCLSSSVYTFDDAHAEAVVHPSGPVAWALLAVAETVPTTGADFLTAFVLGVEFTCRISKAISVAPARSGIAWSQTGVVGGIGAAIAVAKLLGSSPRELVAAIAIAVGQSSGIRTAQGTAASALMPAQGAPAGVKAAFLARQGLTGSADPLAGKYGFVEVFSDQPHAVALTEGLGSRFEVARLTYKPYPCGIVLGPVIDACLALRADHAPPVEAIARVVVRVNPVVLALTDRRQPVDAMAAQVSLYHWAAIPLCDGQASVSGLGDERLHAPEIADLRNKVEVVTDETLATDSAEITIVLADGRRFRHVVEHCVGSAARPMRDSEVERKFRLQCEGRIAADRIGALAEACWTLDELADIGAVTRAAA